MLVDVQESRFLRACRREAVDTTPVWFMRQAGRSLPEYRAIRERYSLLEICRLPEVCTEVTLQPVRRLGVDAAILFADIMLPLIGTGVDLDIVEGVGPVIHNPVRTAADVAALRAIDPRETLPFVLTTIGLLRRELGALPLIGFAGAPFTLAAYLVEGKPSRDFIRVKGLMYREPALWHALMGKLSDLVIAYLQAQIAAGVDAVQLFDSWVGALSPRDYATYVFPHAQRILAAVGGHVPVIHFGTNSATLLDQMAAAGGDVIGVDWRLPLDRAWALVGPGRAVQGNLDPCLLLAPPAVLEAGAQDVLDRAAGRPGHIFNLGHGVHPETTVDQLARLVALVHEYQAAGRAAELAPGAGVR
ncbi:MAG TPA: uroporphyrinogen decarboxylase [Chloroflexia bacterium]|nr:uroporphyrinogen decarboxylase [Chloroflexia bacterium]